MTGTEPVVGEEAATVTIMIGSSRMTTTMGREAEAGAEAETTTIERRTRTRGMKGPAPVADGPDNRRAATGATRMSHPRRRLPGVLRIPQ